MHGRRLPKKLATEVLPDPTRHAGPGAARQRTLEHMTRLLALAASTALQPACSGGGYAVVDPMPSPSRCEWLAAGIHATAEWKKGEAGAAWRMVVKLGAPQLAGARFTEGRPSAIKASVVSVEAAAGGLTIELLLPATAKAGDDLSVMAALECPNGPAAVLVHVRLGEVGGATTVTVGDLSEGS